MKIRYCSLKSFLMVILASILFPAVTSAEFTLGGGVLYVPSDGETFSGDPAVAGTEIDSGTVVFVNGAYAVDEAWVLQAEILWYQSETEEQRTLPGVGPVQGTLDLEGLGGYLNVLYRLDTLIGWDSVVFEVGGGIGYASFENKVTTTVAGFSNRASDRDEAFAWQGIVNLGYRITDSFQLGGSVRYFGFGDLKWEDQGRAVEANNIHAFGFGLFAAVDF